MSNKDSLDAFDQMTSRIEGLRVEELPSDDDDPAFEDITDEDDVQEGQSSNHARTGLPPWLCEDTIHLFHDGPVTRTTEARDEVVRDCLPLLLGDDTQGLSLNSHGIPHLRRSQHIKYLHNTLRRLPAQYQAIDASRPWVFYWAMAGLTSLGQDVSSYRQRLIETLQPIQNPAGGFGGGHGQYSHSAGAYAAVLALASVGGLEMVDRKAMWHWLGTIKQADGGFCVSFGGEEDIRGAYCAMTVISLLNLPIELPPNAPAREAGLRTFLDGLGEWIGRCQTFEGGIGGAPGNEAHGAYAFCALACLSIIDAPHRSIPAYLDIDALLSWLAGIQTTPEGGYAGRANKLVDACYSHWVGGCWSLLQAALQGAGTLNQVETLSNRQAVMRYLLCCCQQPGIRGGMRDKPSVRPDGMHTCYSLSGLSAAQNHYTYREDSIPSTTTRPLPAPFNWTARGPTAEEMDAWEIDEEDRVGFVHPVFAISLEAVQRTKERFEHGTF